VKRQSRAGNSSAGLIIFIVVVIAAIILIPPLLSNIQLPWWLEWAWPSPRQGGTVWSTTTPTIYTTLYTSQDTTVFGTTTQTAVGGFNIRPYRWTVVYNDGSEETTPYNWPWLKIPGPNGGGKLAVALKDVQFQFYGALQVNGIEQQAAVEVTYTIEVEGEGKHIASDSGTLSFLSGQTPITDSSLSVTHASFRAKLGDGFHTVLYRCSATAYVEYGGQKIPSEWTRDIGMDLVITTDGMTVTVA